MSKILKLIMSLLCALSLSGLQACSDDKPDVPDEPDTEIPSVPEPDPEPDEPATESDILVAYFSWGGTTERMARMIADQTGAVLFEIEPVTPYPTAYTPTTEVALEEKNRNARPAIKAKVEEWDRYSTVFIGCPVWWWTTPMIIHTFVESYDFEGKTVIPFCTYAATYRDETLAEIVRITPDAAHLPGLGLTGGQISEDRIGGWLTDIKIK